MESEAKINTYVMSSIHTYFTHTGVHGHINS